MSSSHHDDQHLQEQKPIAFTVPFILASVLILIIVLFLSLCDPKPHVHEAEHDGHSAPVEAVHHNDATMEAHTPAMHGEAAAMKDSATAETTVPAAEPAEHH